MLARLARRRRRHGAAARAGGARWRPRSTSSRATTSAPTTRSGAPPSWRRRRRSGGRRWPSCSALATPVARATLGRALFGDERRARGRGSGADVLPDHRVRAPGPDRRLGPYLVGRQLLARDPARALPHLRARLRRRRAAARRRCRPSSLRECRRMIVDAAYRIGDFPRARAALDRAGRRRRTARPIACARSTCARASTGPPAAAPGRSRAMRPATCR